MSLTWKQPALRSTVADTRPPTLVDLLDLLDEFTFHKAHLVILLGLQPGMSRQRTIWRIPTERTALAS